MKLAYVAGKYRAKTQHEVFANCIEAWKVGAKYAEKGYYPVVPHMSSLMLHDIGDEQFWLEGTMRLMEKCDVVVFMKNWRESSGARAEAERALQLNKEIIYEKDD